MVARVSEQTDEATRGEGPSRGPSRLEPLAAAAVHGGRAEAEQLWIAARPFLLRWALALGADPNAANDLVQDALWAAHRNLNRFDPRRGTPEAWLATILVRLLRNQRRALSRRRRLSAAFAPFVRRSTPPATDPVDARITLARLLDRLTERQREVVALYEIAELGAAASAQILGLTPAGVRSIARDARQRLSNAVRGPSIEERT